MAEGRLGRVGRKRCKTREDQRQQRATFARAHLKHPPSQFVPVQLFIMYDALTQTFYHRWGRTQWKTHVSMESEDGTEKKATSLAESEDATSGGATSWLVCWPLWPSAFQQVFNICGLSNSLCSILQLKPQLGLHIWLGRQKYWLKLKTLSAVFCWFFPSISFIILIFERSSNTFRVFECVFHSVSVFAQRSAPRQYWPAFWAHNH